MFEDSEEKKVRREFAIVSNARETPINETTQEDINAHLAVGHEVDDDRLPDIENKPIPTRNTDLSVYKEGWKWSGIYHRKESDYRQYSEKNYRMDKECINVLT